MKTYKQYIKLTELQLNLSLPITNPTEKEIIDIARNDCIRYIQEFGKYDAILTAKIPLQTKSDYLILSDNSLNNIKKSPLMNDNIDAARFIKQPVDEYIKDKYQTDVSKTFEFGFKKLSKLKIFTKDLWVILPYNTFNWLYINPAWNSYDTLLAAYLAQYATEYGIDNVIDIDRNTINKLKGDTDFYNKFESYLTSGFDFKTGMITGKTFEDTIFGYSTQSKYLAVSYSFYSSHWLHSKIMRPGAISKLVY